MKKFFTLLSLLLALQVSKVKAQDVGLSFSYFIPANGEFSTPISPFSLRGVGLDLVSPFISLETGFTLYRMAGLNLRDIPFESRRALTGPNFTTLVPLELVFKLPLDNFEWSVKGGVFGFYGLGQKLQEGNLDRALRDWESWQVLNSEFSFENKLGWGYHGGTELVFYFSKEFGISLEANYLMGSSRLPLQGSYTGINENGQIETKAASFPEARVDLRGLEFSIGIIFSGR